MPPSTRELLYEYTRLMNLFGLDSPEAIAFLQTNEYNVEFVELACLARQIKEHVPCNPALNLRFVSPESDPSTLTD